MNQEINRGLCEVSEKLSMSQNYHKKSFDRYARILKIAQEHITFNEDVSVAEVGPGLLLPYVRIKYGSKAKAYGLMTGNWRTDLRALDISVSIWDLNSALKNYGQHDIIFFSEVIEHLNRWPIEVLDDVRQLLRPGGLLILTTVNILRLTNRLRVISGKSPLINPFERSEDGRNHVREYTLDEMRLYFRAAGLSVVKTYRWADYPRGKAGAFFTLIGRSFPSTSNYFGIVARRIE